MSFSDLGLSPEVLNAIHDAGYVSPTPIQEKAIPYVLMARDLLGCAQTGTGKTASFTLPMIEILSSGRARARMPRSLILTPTRELATQIAENFEIYGKYNKLTMALLIGGVSIEEQFKKLDRGVDVLIATPGRLLDHFDRGRILLNGIKILVIDEADRMLDMGFIPDVEKIVSLLPKTRQTLFFSATLPVEIRKISEAFLSNPKEIAVAPQSKPAAATVTQELAIVDRREKREALRRLIYTKKIKTALIFCNRKRDVDILEKSLSKHGFNAATLHGDMPQTSRLDTLVKFKENKVDFLVASDVAARGLDIDDLPVVFNFDVPINAEDYIHRIGRTGRAGREGQAYTIASPEDGILVKSVEKLLGNQIPRIEINGLTGKNFDDLSSDAPKRARRRNKKHPERKDAPSKPLETSAKRQHTSEGKTTRSVNGRQKPGDKKIRPHAEREKNPPPSGEEAVVGLGDHMPNFLKRPARPS